MFECLGNFSPFGALITSLLDWTTTYTTFTMAVLLVYDHMSFQNVL